MIDLIQTLQARYARRPDGLRLGQHAHLLRGGEQASSTSRPTSSSSAASRRRLRHNYLLWEEGKGPDFVIELTSTSTRREDQTKKRDLYRDVLRVAEYFLFDPFGEYLKPPLQGYRLVDGDYVPIEPVDGRLPSVVTGLHLEADGTELRLFSPALGRWLPTSAEHRRGGRRRGTAEAARRRGRRGRRGRSRGWRGPPRPRSSGSGARSRP